MAIKYQARITPLKTPSSKHSSYVFPLVMTSLEHVSVKHALDHFPSWTGNGDGDIAEAEAWDEGEVEEVGVGVALTTDDDEVQQIGIALGGDDDVPRAEYRKEYDDDGEDEEEEGGRGGVGGSTSRSRSGSGCGSGSGACRRSSMGVSPASRSRSRSGGSRSNSNSRSQSRSSVRGALEMGESSEATSWTQADAEGVGAARTSNDGNSEGRPSGEVRCRLGAGRVGPEDGVSDVGEAGAPRDGTEAVSLPQLHTATDGNGGGEGRDASRREEVLVLQEVDIGEGWHPLRHHGKARSQEEGEGESEKGEAEVDVGSVHALESVRGGDRSLEMDEKARWGSFRSSGRNVRHLRLEFKPPSPQPWDNPPGENETYASDYYSTLNSKRFGTLQKRCVWAGVGGVLLLIIARDFFSLFHSRRRPLVPHSTYYFGPPPSDSAYGTPPVGQIGVHHPREVVRVERDYVGGELIQFSPVFPLELEGRVRSSRTCMGDMGRSCFTVLGRSHRLSFTKR